VGALCDIGKDGRCIPGRPLGAALLEPCGLRCAVALQVSDREWLAMDDGNAQRLRLCSQMVSMGRGEDVAFRWVGMLQGSASASQLVFNTVCPSRLPCHLSVRLTVTLQGMPACLPVTHDALSLSLSLSYLLLTIAWEGRFWGLVGIDRVGPLTARGLFVGLEVGGQRGRHLRPPLRVLGCSTRRRRHVQLGPHQGGAAGVLPALPAYRACAELIDAVGVGRSCVARWA
jgi:hypothetical protein